MAHSFIAYIDESGDEGFKFRGPGVAGSTLWFSLSAVVVRRTNEIRAMSVINWVRQTLGRSDRHTLHFRHLKHDQRVMYCQRIGNCGALCLVTVLAHKPSLLDKSTLVEGSRLYFFATRILLERISWLCRDAPNRYQDGDGTCKVIFSNRSNLSYEDLCAYLDMISKREECRVDWSVIRPEKIKAFGPQHRGLQLADAVASSFFYAIEPNLYENTEDRYARLLLPRCYRYKGRLNRYGVKICCGSKGDERSLEAAIPWLNPKVESGPPA